MTRTLATSILAAVVVGSAFVLAGPLDPPAGPAGDSGPALQDLAGGASNLDAGVLLPELADPGLAGGQTRPQISVTITDDGAAGGLSFNAWDFRFADDGALLTRALRADPATIALLPAVVSGETIDSVQVAFTRTNGSQLLTVTMQQVIVTNVRLELAEEAIEGYDLSFGSVTIGP